MMKHYIEFVKEDELDYCPVSNRDILILEIPKSAIGYRYYSIEELNIGGEVFTSKKKNYGPTTWFGELYTLDDIKSKYGENNLLIDDMKQNGWDVMVKTRYGEFKPILYKNDIIIPKEMLIS